MQRTQPRIQRGVPGWLIGLIVVVVVVVVLFLGARAFRSSAERGAGTVAGAIAAARQQLEVGNLESALAKVDEIPAAREVSAAEKAAIASIRAEVEIRKAEAELSVANNRGTSWMEVYLKRYERTYLQGTPDLPKVRLFLERLREFEANWPRHPELDWVQRQRSRFQDMVDLGSPPTFSDVEWEVSLLTRTSPRNYRRAFELVDEYLSRPSAPERGAAQGLRDQLVSDREEYAADRLQWARYEYEKEDHAKAMWWLVHNVIWLADPAMADDAAGRLIQIPRADEHLRGYEDLHPEKYRLLLENDIVRRYAKEHGLK